MAIPPSEDLFVSQLITLEALDQANASGALVQPEVKLFADITGGHEAAHVKTLKSVLGSKAVKKPSFDFGDTVTNQDKFKQTAQVLEDEAASEKAVLKAVTGDRLHPVAS
jgi:hypothetical protein